MAWTATFSGGGPASNNLLEFGPTLLVGGPPNFSSVTNALNQDGNFFVGVVNGTSVGTYPNDDWDLEKSDGKPKVRIGKYKAVINGVTYECTISD